MIGSAVADIIPLPEPPPSEPDLPRRGSEGQRLDRRLTFVLARAGFTGRIEATLQSRLGRAVAQAREAGLIGSNVAGSALPGSG